MRFSSSKHGESELTSLEEYVARSPVEQKDIFYLCAPSRQLAEASPYFEAFKKRGVEVLFCHDPIDEFVMTSLMNYEGRRIVSAQSADVDLPEAIEKAGEQAEKEDSKEGAHGAPALEGEKLDKFREWVGHLLRDDVLAVKVSSGARLLAGPPWVGLPPPSPIPTHGCGRAFANDGHSSF